MEKALFLKKSALTRYWNVWSSSHVFADASSFSRHRLQNAFDEMTANIIPQVSLVSVNLPSQLSDKDGRCLDAEASDSLGFFCALVISFREECQIGEEECQGQWISSEDVTFGRMQSMEGLRITV
ncbi:hypothetical protein Tco_0526506 [Tanacetum coccineum]